MTTHHVGSLLIAAMLFLACEFSGKCSDKMIDHASQLSMTIAVATFAHAQGNRTSAAPKNPEDRNGSAR
jgi:hypothetical protein